METYEAIREWKDNTIIHYLSNTTSLNDFHDQVMHKVLHVAKGKVGVGSPPCDFSWFITGSGGRYEQGVISDQDHGLVYESSSEENDKYFERLGEELAYGLHIAGYPYCLGKVMTSNSLWCKSFPSWQNQIQQWLEDDSWEAIRYLQIFFDARVLVGNRQFIQQLKSQIFDFHLIHPAHLKRFFINIMHIKNGIGPVGQILVEKHGVYQGCVNLKYAAFLPYVNAVRVLALKERIYETSTLGRIEKLIQQKGYETLLGPCEISFSALLTYRLSLSKVETYLDAHYLDINKLSKEKRRDIKRIMKDGKKLHDEVMGMFSYEN